MDSLLIHMQSNKRKEGVKDQIKWNFVGTFMIIKRKRVILVLLSKQLRNSLCHTGSSLKSFGFYCTHSKSPGEEDCENTLKLVTMK